MKKTVGILLALAMMLAWAAPAAAQLDSDEDLLQMGAYAKFSGGSTELLIAMEMDAGSASTAKRMLSMAEEDPDIMGEVLQNPEPYTKSTPKGCVAFTGTTELEGEAEPSMMVMCAKGSSLFMFLGTDNEDTLALVKSTLKTGLIELPSGYVDMTDMLN